jgi:type II secretory pathway pseudopilin PulG
LLNTFLSRQRGNRGQTLVAMLIVVAIILVLAVVMFKGSSAFGGKPLPARKDGLGTTVLGQSRYAAKDDVCRSNLSQLRQAIQVYESTNDDHPPDTLAETKIGSEFYSCPIGHEPYQYDPATGQVHCIHPGHENF